MIIIVFLLLLLLLPIITLILITVIHYQVKKTINKDEFRLRHYAGEVAYRVQGFLDKNNDLLFRDLKDTMSKASNIIAKSVFPRVRISSALRYSIIF